MKKPLTLRTRFVLSFSIIIIIFTLVLSSIISLNLIEVYRKESGSVLLQKALQMTNILERFLWARTVELDFVSEVISNRDMSDSDEIRSILDDLKKDISPYVWVAFIDSNGIVVEATDDYLKGQDMSEKPIYNLALNNNYTGQVYKVKLTDESSNNTINNEIKVLEISIPAYLDDGTFIGVIASYLDWNWIEKTAETMYLHTDNEKNTDIMIVNSKDNLVLLGPNQLQDKYIDLDILEKVKQETKGWETATWEDGYDYFTAYVLKSDFSEFQSTQWIVIARQPITSIYGYLKENVLFAIKFAAIAAIVFALIGLIVANRITKPLKLLTIASVKLREGEYVEIPKLKGAREIQLLASSLDSLIKSLAITKGELGEMTGLANLDKLTQLPNRIALENHLQTLITNNAGQTFTILYMDLDGFKSVNDTYGHPVGDKLLQEVASRIKKCIAKDELVARIGGDEFVVVVNNSKEDVRKRGKLIANNIINELSKIYIIDKQKIRIGCSVGGAIWNIDSTDINELASKADQALYTSKNNGKGIFTYCS